MLVGKYRVSTHDENFWERILLVGADHARGITLVRKEHAGGAKSSNLTCKSNMILAMQVSGDETCWR